MILPSLKKNDTIGIISTARTISLSEIQTAINLIKEKGYQVALGKNLFNEDYQFSGTIRERSFDLQEMLDNSKIKAILCARGGYGTVQIISHLQFDQFIKEPKWIIGYSDITVLHSYIHNQFGIPTLHATMPINFKDYNTESKPIVSLFNVLEGKKNSYQIPYHKYNKKGKNEGLIIGGNLSILYSLRGTPADINYDEKILFIEDLDEYLYHIDRMIMNLKWSGKLKNLKGLIVGGMSGMNDNTIPFGKSAEEIIRDAVAEYNYPVLFNFPAGHVKDNRAITLGTHVQISVDEKGSSVTFV
jgi:muramoyltetrapeptide carboxypeptidase